MERYCISLEQAKRLRELGFDGDSFFKWGRDRDWADSDRKWRLCWNIGSVFNELLPAYHVGELGDLLPEDVRTYRYDGLWSVYFPVDGIMELFKESYPTEAQARGALLIYLLEMKLI